MNATRQRLGAKDVLLLARSVDVVHAAKGRKVVTLDVKRDRPSDAELLAVLLGPTGNLRAPAWRRGRVLVVGFDEEMYAAVLK